MIAGGVALEPRSSPRAREDLILREFDNEVIAWSPIGSEPVLLEPLPGVILQLLDGDVSVGELVADLAAVLEVDESAAREQLRHELSLLHDAGMLTTSTASAEPDLEPEVFPSSWNT